MLPHIIKDYSTEKGVPICLHENKFFRMMFNGYYHYLDGVRYGAGVQTVPMFENGDVLMVRLRRTPAIGFSLEFPRGGVDSSESLEKAVCRELAEETGYVIEESALTYLGLVAGDTATLNGTMPVYLVRLPEGVKAGEFDAQEIDSVFRVPAATFKAWVLEGKIVDGLSLSAYALALFKGLASV